MNTKNIKWMAAGLIALVMVQVFSSASLTKAQPVTPLDPSREEYILDRTVQIKLFAPLPASENEAGTADNGIKSYVMAKGLGTLVSLDGKLVIVTHNHWGGMLKDAEYVTLHEANGDLLVKMALNEFTSLIRYNDPGTLILDAPAGLSLEAAELDDDISLVSRDIVHMVRQDPQDPEKVEVIQASMLNMKNYKGHPVFKLAVLAEGLILPGDSGGGIWHDGELVGNTWASFINTIKLPNAPETSLAAPLPTL